MTLLRSAIVRGELAPGSWLKVGDLAQSLNLSTTPTREALVQLAGEGLVESVPHRGHRVAPLDLAGIVEILQVQIPLWALGYQWGVPRLEDAAMQELEVHHARYREAYRRQDALAGVQTSHAFHGVVLRACGNRELLRLSQDRVALVHRFATLHAGDIDARAMSAISDELLQAVKRRDAATAVAHFAHVSQMLLDLATRLNRDAPPSAS